MRESTYTVWIVCVFISAGVTGAVVLPEAIETYNGIPGGEWVVVLAYFFAIIGGAILATDRLNNGKVTNNE